MNLAAPEGGWKAGSFYLVEVAWSCHNPIHRCVFFSGFLTDTGQPGGYSCLMNPMYGTSVQWKAQLAYFNPLKEILSKEEFHTADTIELISDRVKTVET